MESRVSVLEVVVESGVSGVIKSGEFKGFDWKEKHLEELLTTGAMLFPSGDVKIVGRQVHVDYNWQVDLVGLRKNGQIVIIEVKRDQKDISARSEPCEVQVMRYASALEGVVDLESLLHTCYFDFCCDREDLSGKSETEIIDILVAELSDHLSTNARIDSKNPQLIIVASGFDAGTIAVCNWLMDRGIVISCMQVSPFSNESGRVLLVVDRVFPLETLDELKLRTIRKRNRNAERGQFISVREMFELCLLNIGQKIFIRKSDGSHASAEIVGIDAVVDSDTKQSTTWNEWAKSHRSGSFSIYQYVRVDSPTGKTLNDLRLVDENRILPFRENFSNK